MEAGSQVGPTFPRQSSVLGVAFSPDGRTLLTGSTDGMARTWDRATGRESGRPMGHSGFIEAVAFSPDGRAVFTGSYDRTARLWEKATGKPIGPAFRHESQVWFVAFNPRSRTVLSGGRENTAHRWAVPPTTEVPLESLRNRVQVSTGMEILDDGSLPILGLAEWAGRRSRDDRRRGPRT